jgi:hypothetical protein
MIFCNSTGGVICNSSFSVPKGYRLVITTVSGRVAQSSGAQFRLAFTLSGVTRTQLFTMDAAVIEFGQPIHGQTHNVFVVADSILIDQSWLTDGVGNIYLSGYLVKM